MSSAEFDEAIRLRTGGIGASTFLATHRQGMPNCLDDYMFRQESFSFLPRTDLDGYQEGITLSGNCLDRNVDHMFGLLDKMMTDVDFSAVDRERVRTIVLNVGVRASLLLEDSCL